MKLKFNRRWPAWRAPLRCFCRSLVLAADEKPKLDTGDTAWMLTSTALVLMMTIPGLALFYGGMVRKKNVLATVMQSFAITCLISVLWLIVGYSLAFTSGSTIIGGLGRVFHARRDPRRRAASSPRPFPKRSIMCFQLTFAIITPALIAGAFAERMKFSAMMWFMALWSLIVYAPIAHWVWGGGFLGDWGVLDFAGGTVVHINAGVAGLVCALVLGKRQGFGAENMAPHNLVYSVIGASLLWVGWFGFNAGSAGARQRQCRHGDGRDAVRHGGGGTVLDVRGVGDPRQAVGAGHHLRRGRRPGRHHAGLRLRQSDGRAGDRHRRRPGLLLGRHQPQAGAWVTTIRSTPSACTASAASSAPS